VSNVAAYRLYTGLGFDEVGVRKNYYPARHGREDAIILARDLSAGSGA
jgi:ribosomal-protein-alanine N-acetyltransferase